MISIESHVKEIERVTGGACSARDDAVVQSWRRCVNDYRLDPANARNAYIVPQARLREHQEQAEALIRISRAGLASLFDQVASDDYVLLLSDARGVAVDYLGHPRLDDELRRAGLYLGAEWSESRAGTCAVGACLVSGEPVVIHQDDHFDTTHASLTCTAAPIFDTRGELAAVLDMSQLRSPVPKSSQRLALHLAKATARRIEMANLVARTGDEWVLRLARTPDFLDTAPDAALSLDGAGRISGVTASGLAALGSQLGWSVGSARALIGCPISSLFDIGIDDLPAFMRGQPAGQRLLHVNGEPLLFASAMSPAHGRRSAGPVISMPRAEPAAVADQCDAAVQELQTRAAKLAARRIPILIQGETGSGKEVLARAIHAECSEGGRFVAVNCAAIPEQLIESELFGHVPHAFTGADRKGRTGLIESAQGGTLFLDEIGDMPLSLQTRLLRVLSENEVVPVGGVEPRPVELRLVSATHQALETRVAEGRFREDLYYRLNAATLHLPPLRERSDLDTLLDELLVDIGRRHQAHYRLEPGAQRLLRAYRWPGNLRELRNALEVAAALCDDGLVREKDLPERIRQPHGQGPSLLHKLDQCHGNVSALARELGVDRSTVHRWLKRARN
ncbi:sigma-54-dependent Fis family transcriptional regulator [Salinisphaera sp.]|uniref:sigma-54-dependent Fis family transcriptional regulator n=1 Tax=Salinisphaera sp. TaxID=1914330 RepID=UPI000C4FA20D|nr:sigma-54-dependent Fis family transcriptional regulator [Salinisphaera sp.]MBS62689.1 sigma-54-dependent Fis family transcriptional regulator [Salinisphaera sp.]